MTTSAVSKRYFSVKETSRYTGLPASTLYDWAAQGIIPSIKIRRRVLFDLEDIDLLMAKQKREPVNPDTKARKILDGFNEGIYCSAVAVWRTHSGHRKEVVMFKRGSVYWTCIRKNGKKVQRSLGTASMKLAKEIEAKIRTQLAEGKYIERLSGDFITVAMMMEQFMSEHAPKVSTGTQVSYRASLKHILPVLGDIALTSVSSKIISRYKVKRLNEGCAPATLNRELAMLSKAFNLAVREWEYVNENPISKVPFEKENNERDRWLALEEEKALLANCPEWLKEIVIFAVNMGMRQGEILSMEWQRVDLFRKVVIITESKNGKPRTVPLNSTVFELLKRKSKVRNIVSKTVFTNGAGSKIDRHNLRRAFNKATKSAGIENFRFHDIRHTFATRLAQRGFDIYAIAKLLGHKDIRMTQRYSHHCPESLRRGVEMLEADYNLTTVGLDQMV